tara:strand:+ start:2519 stop:2767 length:249 start_codon:yes stop_codon:yes gene_type:complete
MSDSRSLRKSVATGVNSGPTIGQSSPKNSRRGCLCADTDTYSRECCDGLLINQGIGQTQSVIVSEGAFSQGFSNGFDIREIR